MQAKLVFSMIYLTSPKTCFHTWYIFHDQFLNLISSLYFNAKAIICSTDLNNNELRRLEKGLFKDNTNLKTINVGSNNIDVIEEGVFEFASTSKLEKFDASGNTIPLLPPFGNHPAMTEM